MKVLLLGEYSGFFLHLKKGLQCIGQECVLAANGDGWKNIEGSDMLLYDMSYKNRIDRTYKFFLEPIINRHRFSGFDVVYMVNPSIFHPLINTAMFKMIKKCNGTVCTSIAGDCLPVYESYKSGKLGYNIYDNNDELIEKYDEKIPKYRRFVNTEKYVLDHTDAIIPTLYEYAVGVKNRKNCNSTIPFAFDTSGIEYKDNIVKNGKLVIFHGLIREKYKGTEYILKALEIIKEKYSNDVDIIVDGKMPLNKYTNLLENVNILVDQCKEHGYGLNALYGMAKGRIVLGGASRNTLKEMGVDRCPVLHIKPDVDQIVSQIEYIISNKKLIKEMGQESRKYVENIHNHIKIAEKYVDLWKGLLSQ